MAIQPVTARARVRAAILEELKAAARRQLGERGAAALSVREVARDVGMSSSGIYRYFKSRDELLTALIVDTYNELGDEVERAEAAVDRADLFGRWWAAARAVREWARARPQEYGLLYGSPVPGYAAPPDTVGPASRVPVVLATILRDLGPRADGAGADAGSGHGIEPDVEKVGPLVGLDHALVAEGILAWVELFGLVTFEVFGHLKGTVRDADDFFAWACGRTAARLGIPSD